jgi:hypothetical protein
VETTPAKLDQAALTELDAAFAGELVLPDGADFDRHRAVWNGSIDRRPVLIARCAGKDDVAAVLTLARRTGLPLAVRGGGHSFPGQSVCDDGIVADLGPMKRVEVDPEAGTVRAQGGILLGELDRATQEHGLAVPAGIVTHTGLAGLTLGGGIGWLQRKHGLTIDQLLSVEVVTAEGEVVRASEEENADLFWGIRGGGGNFGVVTDFEFRLSAVGPLVLAGPIFWLMEDSPRLLRFYREWVAEAPDDLMTIVLHRRAPEASYVPTALHGELVVAVICCYAGSVEDGERAIAPLKAFGSPVLDLCEPKPFVDHQSMFDPSFPHGRWYYMRSCDVDELSDEVIDITVEHSMRIQSPFTGFPIWQMGGAVSRVGEEETAFNGRGAGHTFNLTASTAGPDGFDEEREWVRSFWTALEPHHSESVYVNFLMSEGEDRVREAYGAGKYERLERLKRRYDPGNLFRLNQNIPPG